MKVLINSDEELVKEIRSAIKEADGHCPCAVERTSDTKCMCKNFRDQIERGEAGECHCGLYVIVNE